MTLSISFTFILLSAIPLNAILYCTQQEFKLLRQDSLQDFDQYVQQQSWFEKQRLEQLNTIKNEIMWHLKTPEVGILTSNKKKLRKAHCKPLHEFAPQQGKGTVIAVIDTGAIQNCKRVKNILTTDKFEITKKIKHDSLKKALKKITVLKNQESFKGCFQLQKESPVHSLYRNIESLFFDKILQNPCVDIPLYHDSAGHGTTTTSIINQLAPQSDIIMLKAFDEQGYTTKQELLKALLIAYYLDVDIVHLGLKILTTYNTQDNIDRAIMYLIKKLKCVVLASGNDGYCHKDDAFFRKLPKNVYTVGSYEQNKNDIKISHFSHASPTWSPEFVAPGGLVTSLGFIAYRYEPVYTLSFGTSIAAAMVTGFLGLLFTENQGNFTFQQLKQIVSQNCISVYPSTKVYFGAIDMRSCLLTLSMLSYLQQNVPKVFFKKNFDNLITLINQNNAYQPFQLCIKNNNVLENLIQEGMRICLASGLSKEKV